MPEKSRLSEGKSGKILIVDEDYDFLNSCINVVEEEF